MIESLGTTTSPFEGRHLYGITGCIITFFYTQNFSLLSSDRNFLDQEDSDTSISCNGHTHIYLTIIPHSRNTYLSCIYLLFRAVHVEMKNFDLKIEACSSNIM